MLDSATIKKIAIHIVPKTDIVFSDINALENSILYELNSIRNIASKVRISKKTNIRYQMFIRRNYTMVKADNEDFFVEQNHTLLSESDVFILIEILPNEDDIVIDTINKYVAAINSGHMRIGNNITLGCGKCVCKSVVTDIGKSVPISYTVKSPRRIVVDMHDIDGIAIYDNRKHDKLIKNNLDEFIIPASTWKGVFRQRITEWIVKHEDNKELIDILFGNRLLGIKGKLIFYESVFKKYNIVKKKRVHIDKFTGATFGAGIQEKDYISGKFQLFIDILDNCDYEKYINLVLRDLHHHRVNIGSGFGIGRGFIHIDNINFDAN